MSRISSDKSVIPSSANHSPAADSRRNSKSLNQSFYLNQRRLSEQLLDVILRPVGFTTGFFTPLCIFAVVRELRAAQTAD